MRLIRSLQVVLGLAATTGAVVVLSGSALAAEGGPATTPQNPADLHQGPVAPIQPPFAPPAFDPAFEAPQVIPPTSGPDQPAPVGPMAPNPPADRKSTRLNSS